jgi:hypothetical protein
LTDAQLVEPPGAASLAAFGHLVERYQDMVVRDRIQRDGRSLPRRDVAQDVHRGMASAHRVRDVMRSPWLAGIAQPRPRRSGAGVTYCRAVRRSHEPEPERIRRSRAACRTHRA